MQRAVCGAILNQWPLSVDADWGGQVDQKPFPSFIERLAQLNTFTSLHLRNANDKDKMILNISTASML